MAKRGSEAWRRNVGRGTRRGQKPWRDGLRVLPKHQRVFLQRGQVEPAMRPVVHDALQLLGRYSDQLGGAEALTAGQRVALKALFRATVVVDAAFTRVLRGGELTALDGLGAMLQAERSAIAALGLERARPQAPSVEEYLAAAGRDAAAELADDRQPLALVGSRGARDGDCS